MKPEWSLASVNEAVSASIPEREAIIHGGRRITYSTLDDRARRFANFLAGHGLGAHQERIRLAGHESGQDHVAICLHNCPSYIEAMLGCFKARAVPINVNYRYVATEMRYLLDDSRARGIVFGSMFSEVIDDVRRDLPHLDLLVQVDDGTSSRLVDGAVWYEDAIETSKDTTSKDTTSMSSGLDATPTPDDLYVIYTGGTTGMPKGVLWRQGDIFAAAMGGCDVATGEQWRDLDAILDNAATESVKMMPTAPFMHGAAHWMAITALNWGNTVVLPSNTTRLDAADIWITVEREGVNAMLIVGDAFARPLIEELERRPYDLSSMIMLVSGGAALSAPVKDRFLELIPSMAILDGLGSSETGQQASQVSGTGAHAETGTFRPGAWTRIISEDLTRVLDTSEGEIGWLAQHGHIPLGYLGDEQRTAQRFPVIAGTRYSIPGDRAAWTPEGSVRFLGRDSTVINSGGEKVFAEEVELALTAHPDVYDAVVTSRPDPRWGEAVVAIIELRDGALATRDDIIGSCDGKLARFKLPRSVIFVDRIVRSPAGKADHRWARQVATGSTTVD